MGILCRLNSSRGRRQIKSFSSIGRGVNFITFAFMSHETGVIFDNSVTNVTGDSSSFRCSRGTIS